MEIINTEGCTCYGTTINNKDIQDYSKEELKWVLDQLILELDLTQTELQDIINLIVTTHGEYKFLYHCEQCDDDVCEYKLKI